jgi:energy-coupling factor transport system permease protein
MALTPFRYQGGKSFLHRMNPSAKFLCLIILSAGLMAAPPFLAAGLAALCAVSVVAMRIGVRELAAKGRFLVWMAAFVFILKCLDFSRPFFFDAEKLIPASLYVANLVILFLLAELFFRSTRIRDLGASVSMFFRKLTRRQDVDPGLYLALAVDFIPRVFSVYQECADAARARGFDEKRFRRKALVPLIIAYMRISIQKALWTADALEARCYRPDRSLMAPQAGAVDAIACIACAAFCAASFAFERIFPAIGVFPYR